MIAVITALAALLEGILIYNALLHPISERIFWREARPAFGSVIGFVDSNTA
jgi:hypothetical protein